MNIAPAHYMANIKAKLLYLYLVFVGGKKQDGFVEGWIQEIVLFDAIKKFVYP